MKPLVLLLAVLSAIVASALAAQAQCPEINGRFQRKEIVGNKEDIWTIVQFSRVKGGVASYSYVSSDRTSANDDEFFPADGKPHRGVFDGMKVTITVRCENGSVLFSVLADEAEKGEAPFWARMKPVGPKSVELTSLDVDAAGIYHKVD